MNSKEKPVLSKHIFIPLVSKTFRLEGDPVLTYDILVGNARRTKCRKENYNFISITPSREKEINQPGVEQIDKQTKTYEYNVHDEHLNQAMLRLESEIKFLKEVSAVCDFDLPPKNEEVENN